MSRADVGGQTTIERPETPGGPGRTAGRALGLLVAWSQAEPDRVGEVLLVRRRDGEVVLGRDDATDLLRQRPGRNLPTGPLRDPAVSRRQLLVEATGESTIRVKQAGRGELIQDGMAVEEATVRPGQLLRLDDRLVLLCVRRPGTLPEAPSFPAAEVPAFGRPDRFGLVGESPLAWALRDQAGMVGRLPHHVLVLGESGAGKELLARAIHGLSLRKGRPLVSRSAATIPAGIAAAELFGSVRNYPQGGMSSRPGLVGEAAGGTLFLDELGELPDELQAQLLRVLDGAGEYQRLGEVRVRKADLRVIAATNRGADELRHDLVPRFKLRVSVPGLNERRDDVPLLVRHLLGIAFANDQALAKRFQADGEPRIDPALVQALCRFDYSHHVRELDGFLWRALTTSRGSRVELTSDLAKDLKVDVPDEPVSPDDVTKEMLVAALERSEGIIDRAWRELHLVNRYAIHRLLKRYAIDLAAFRNRER